ncbi:MAG: hypothetical protein E7509_05875 [Ruminococcus sp.]|nr:hypothetical protein [Ruminococcus sp.]
MENNVENTIDLKVLFGALVRHLKFIAIVTIMFAVGAFCITKFFITDKYTAKAQIYVDPRNNTSDQASPSYQELSAAEKLVNTCQILFTGDRMVDYVAKDLKDLYDIDEFSNSQLKSMISVQAASTGTSVMNIEVVSDNPEMSAVVANLVLSRANEVYKDIVEGGIVKTVNEAVVPKHPSSPNAVKNTLLGFVLGFVFSCGLIVVLELVDTKIKPSDDLEQLYGIPLFAEILDFESNVKGGY